MNQHPLSTEVASPHLRNEEFPVVRERFVQIAHAASANQVSELEQLCALLVDLTTLAEMSQNSPSDDESSLEIRNFCRETLPVLDHALQGETGSEREILSRLNLLKSRWGEYLDLLSPADRFSENSSQSWAESGDHHWDGNEPTTLFTTPEVPFCAGDVTELISSLSLLTGNSSASSPQHSTRNVPHQPPQRSQVSQELSATNILEGASQGFSQANPETSKFSDLIQETIEDPELISAYVDDAQQCLAGMESCLLELENDKNAVDSLRQFCRELHTLKGASGTVGLMKLAEYLHLLESDVEEMSKGGKKVQIDPLLQGVDFVRQQLSKFLPEGSEIPHAVSRPVVQAASPSGASVPEATGETYVRLEASRLDRLMDLLAELVMLRNRRDTYVSLLQNLHHEVNSCAKRLRLIDTYSMSAEIGTDAASEGQIQHDRSRAKELTATITEISKDVGELGRALDEVVSPLSKDNATISHLIGNFRTELMELRRQPVAGLFRRLHRVARDASKTENRPVELNFIGQGTRAERSFQERLYEPLMHLIRNAVSHGIEPAQERLELGKPALGQVTLEAWSDATSLYLEIKDDGRGLNEHVLEKRGRELGLISPESHPSKENLWELILQPGFSTKKEVSQISGRGVGMDVVASQIRSMRGRVTIDSVIGQFTSFLLEIPLSSTIEHAMIVRCGEQLFALPMHAIYGTQTEDQNIDHLKVVGLHQLLGIHSSNSSTQRVITLRHQGTSANTEATDSQARGNLAILVDAVVGVEEVVVRSLPNLLRNHQCFSGVTLSGEAETVLMLDVPRLSEFAFQFQVQGGVPVAPVARTSRRRGPTAVRDRELERGLNSQSPQILVVDDSISVRRSLIRKLQMHGFEIVEAADGLQGLEKLRSGNFAAVISDLDMPRMNGVDFITEIRRSEKNEDVPIVVVTSRRDSSATKALQGLEIRQIFKKPVTDSMVKSLVQAIRFRTPTAKHVAQ